MKKETEPPTSPQNNWQLLDDNQELVPPPIPVRPRDDAPEDEWERYYCDIEEATARYLRYQRAQTERDALDKIVFSLESVLADDCTDGLPDFSDMLTMNAKALNAAFEYYLTCARQSPAGDEKILMALRMQAQLTRTIDTWRRLENFQIEQTK